MFALRVRVECLPGVPRYTIQKTKNKKNKLPTKKHITFLVMYIKNSSFKQPSLDIKQIKREK